MKKLVLLFCVASLMVSCTNTYQVVSTSAYEKARNAVASNMAANGYMLSGENHDQRNEVMVTGQSYSQYSGYGTLMDNNYHQFDTYRFANKDGETVEYTVKYKSVLADGGGYALSDVNVLGCSTSKASDYAKLCTGLSSPSAKIGQMPQDATYTVLDEEGTLVVVTVVSVALAIIVGALML